MFPSLLFWAAGVVACVLALGWAIRTYGTPGQRTYLYAHLSSGLSMAAAAGAFALSQMDILAQLGLSGAKIAVITLAAKGADWLNQIWGRKLTSGGG